MRRRWRKNARVRLGQLALTSRLRTLQRGASQFRRAFLSELAVNATSQTDPGGSREKHGGQLGWAIATIHTLATMEQEENPMIDLYFWPTGNGKKTIILLEELGLPYTIKPINIGRGDQLTPEFLKISPNGRMPAIVDSEPMGGGAPLSIFESGPIMMYLAEKTGRFWPQDPRGKYDVAQWVGW